MPRKSRYSKRSRRSYKKRYRSNRYRKMVNPLKTGIPNSMRKLAVQLSCILDVVVEGTTPVGLKYVQVILPLNFPGRGILDQGSQTGVYGNLPNLSEIFPFFIGDGISTDLLWDEYKVQKLVARFMPEAQIVRNDNDMSGVNNPDPNLVYHMNDVDDTSMIAPASDVETFYMNNGKFPKTFAPGRPLTFVYKQLSDKRNRYLNTSFAQDVKPDDTNFSYANSGFNDPFGSMKLCFVTQNQAAPAQVGRLYVTWHCIMRGINNIFNPTGDPEDIPHQ